MENNKIKRMERHDLIIAGERVRHYEWQCTVCKKVHLFAYDAKKCTHKKIQDVKYLGKRWVNIVTGEVSYCRGDKEYLEHLNKQGVA